MDSLDKRTKLREMDMRFGTWNERSLYIAGSLMIIAKEISKYKLDSVRVQEVRRDRVVVEPCNDQTCMYTLAVSNNTAASPPLSTAQPDEPNICYSWRIISNSGSQQAC
jgi:hypothetical protein